MICKECRFFVKCANTDETGFGICSIQDDYQVAHADDVCVYEPHKYTCEDCARLVEDSACMTQEAEDSAYHEINGKEELCGGFIDKNEEQLTRIFFDWLTRGYDIDAKIAEAKAGLKDFMERWDKR